MPTDPATGDPGEPPKTVDPPPGEPPKVADAAATTEPAKTADPPKTTDPPKDDPPERVAEYFDRLTGHKTADKYTTDVDWAKGVGETLRVVGRRDADAELGREFRGREAEIRQLLKQQPGAATTSPLDDAIKNFDLTWVTTDSEGRSVPTAGAPADVEDRYRRYQAALAQRMDKIARDPAAFLAPHLEKAEQRLQEQQQQQADQREQETVAAWLEENKDWLFVGGDTGGQLTAAGKKVQQKDAVMVDPTPVQRLEIAAEAVRKQQPSLRGKGSPGGKAAHQPAVAAAPPAEEGLDELFARRGPDGEKLGLSKLLQLRDEQLQAETQ